VIRAASGAAVDGALITVFETGTSTPAGTFHDADLTNPWTQPIECDADGSPEGLVFVDQTPALDVFVTDANGVSIPAYNAIAWSPYALGS
jgi:hypothetical protein